MMIVVSSFVARIASAILLVPTDVVEQELPMMEPLPRSWNEWKHRMWVDSILEKYWNEIDGYQIQAYDEWLVDKNGREWKQKHRSKQQQENFQFRPSVYGEITSLGARQLFHHMELTTTKSSVDFGDDTTSRDEASSVVFMDWGSGTGKLIAQACLELSDLSPSFDNDPTKTKRRLDQAIGIELALSRHELALVSKTHLLTGSLVDLDDAQAEWLRSAMQFRQGDLLKDDSTTKATHVYISSLCFTPDMMHHLEEKIASGHDRLEWVATLRQLPNSSIIPQVHYIEMSWSRPKGTAVYFYHFGKKST